MFRINRILCNVIKKRLSFLTDRTMHQHCKITTNSITDNGHIQNFAYKNENALQLISRIIVPITMPVKHKETILDQRLPIYDKLRIGTFLPVIKKIDETPVQKIRIIEPLLPNMVEKRGVGWNMIVVRKRKMKVHKRKKLAKRMKFIWAKQERKKQAKQEHKFQEEIMSQLKEAEKFNAVSYVDKNLEIVNLEILPYKYRGKYLPEWVIREEFEDSARKKQAKAEKKQRRIEMKNERGGSLAVDPD